LYKGLKSEVECFGVKRLRLNQFLRQEGLDEVNLHASDKSFLGGPCSSSTAYKRIHYQEWSFVDRRCALVGGTLDISSNASLSRFTSEDSPLLH
jgi:hypothetical protein